MSGGSFNYLAFRLDDTHDVIGSSVINDLLSMADHLSEEDEKDAAKEIRKAANHLRKISERIQSRYGEGSYFNKLIHDAEWWVSHDIGQDDFRKTWEEYKSFHAARRADLQAHFLNSAEN